MKRGLDRFNQHLEIIVFARARDVYKEYSLVGEGQGWGQYFLINHPKKREDVPALCDTSSLFFP